MHKNRLYNTLLFICFLGYGWIVLSRLAISVPVKCLFRAVTGVPCPACGNTRAVVTFFKGNILEALYYNPLGILLACLSLIVSIWIIGDKLYHNNSFFRAYQYAEQLLKNKYIYIPAIILVTSNWVWNIFKYY